MKNPSTIQNIRELHRTGQWDAAKAGYLGYLQQDPTNIELLDSLGILCAQQNNITEAIYYFKTALAIQPTHPILNLHLANIYKMENRYNEAALILEKTIQTNPDYAPAINNLGTVYYAKGQFESAVHAYQQAIKKQPGYIDAYYNLGLALTKQSKFSDAIHNYMLLLEQDPNHFAARFHLGCILMHDNKIAEAISVFLQIEAMHPNHFETQTNLATCYLKQGLLNEAKLHYFKALELTPQDTQILFNLGVINMQQGYIDIAIKHYLHALEINPDNFSIHNNLGVAFLAKQQLNAAIHHFQEALHIQPNNVSINHTLKFISERQHLIASPPEYIKSLFDSYADHYEQHLLQTLDYQLPDLLLNTLLTLSKSKNWNILDLGCGTGLCGVLFKPYANNLVGVDLSPKMLEIAAQKHIYNELILADITTYLTNESLSYDLILAADVLVYIGDLDALFKNISRTLSVNGLFLFNAEINEESDFKINSSGRFSHHKKYLEKLASKNNLDLVYYEKIITRMQNDEPVYGHLIALRRYN